MKFKGWEGGELSVGQLEGSSAPCIIVKDEDKTVVFAPESPQQVSDIIAALYPYSKAAQ